MIFLSDNLSINVQVDEDTIKFDQSKYFLLVKAFFLDVCFIIPVNFEDSLQNEERAGRKIRAIYEILRQWSIKITVGAPYFVISQPENRTKLRAQVPYFVRFLGSEITKQGPQL